MIEEMRVLQKAEELGNSVEAVTREIKRVASVKCRLNKMPGRSDYALKMASVTEEEDTSGGKRKVSSTTNKKEVVSSNNDVITQSVTSPQIQGAVVIAKGAGDANVKANIIQAVEAATGLSTYKIQVFEMN